MEDAISCILINGVYAWSVLYNPCSIYDLIDLSLGAIGIYGHLDSVAPRGRFDPTPDLRLIVS